MLFKFQTYMTGERAFKKKFLLGKLFFHQYESNKHGGFKIREMTATSFGRFHMESPIYKKDTQFRPQSFFLL